MSDESTPIKPIHGLKHTTLRAQVMRLLQDEISERHKPGDRLETELQLVKRFGVSLITVKEALGQLAHQGLIERRQGRGTFVTGVTPLPAMARIALVSDIDAERIRTSTFFLPLLRRVEEQLAANGQSARYYFGLGTSTGAPGLSGFLADLRGGLVSGVVAAGLTPTPDLLAACAAANVPLIAAAPGFASVVNFDRIALLGEGLLGLVACGRRRLGLLAATLDDEGHMRRLPVIAAGTVSLSVAVPGAANVQEVMQAVDGLLAADPRPDALLVCDDSWMPSVMVALSARGLRVSDDLLICQGYNEGAAEPGYPCLLMEIDLTAMANALHRQLRALLDGTGQPAVRLVPGRVRTCGGLRFSGQRPA